MNKKTQNTKGLFIKLLCIFLLSALFLGACNLAVKNNSENSSNTLPAENNSSTKAANDNFSDNTDKAIDATPSSAEDTVPDKAAASISEVQPLEQRVRQKLSGMTLKEKAAQIFVITPEALTGYKKVTVAGDATYNALKAYPVGGLIYFGANIINPGQLKTMTENTQKYAKKIEDMPLFLAVDEEGGTVARIAKNSNFKVKKFSNMASIGATKDFDKAYQVGKTIGEYLHEYGLNLDFAPDADVLTNPGNKVIGSRSFGSDGTLVAKMALAAAHGLSDSKVLSCFKHFPGHGATEGDTHAGFAYTNRSLNDLKKSELIPFQTASDNNIPFIMISHISVPAVIGDNTPSSLSKVIITDILRKQMGYTGIIITDSMSMGAIVNTYGTKDAVIKSIQAGADMLLTPKDFEVAYQGVLDAIADGTISEQRIDESLERILRVKLSMSD